MLKASPDQSLSEVHSSVATSKGSVLRRMLAFAGPAYLVSIGYMDPGNWATDIEGGARFGYQLLWVLVLSNLMAILLQTLSARLGIAAGMDLAQACRDAYPRPVSLSLWVLCEIAIAACDLAEVLGAAIGLNLLFGLPLIAGVVLTAADSLLLLWVTRYGIRVLEGVVLGFIAVIGVCFLIEMRLAQPEWGQVALGLWPRLSDESLYVAIGILGATVMPHNLYLHSALVQTRKIGRDPASKREACRYNLLDSVVALNAALFVNAGILILAAAVFHRNGVAVTQIQQAHQLLAPLLGTALASTLFGVALLCSGQSSTLTGTMAGQIVMEGFLNLRVRPWLRRLITRLLAVIPAVITIAAAGDEGTYQLLLLSQVILSLQLPFAVIPLIRFTSDPARMGALANPGWVKVLSWLAAGLIVALNLRLAGTTLAEWAGGSGWRNSLGWELFPVLAGLLVLLCWVAFEPWLPSRWRKERAEAQPAVPLVAPVPAAETLSRPVYRHILVPLDHSEADRAALSHATALARSYGARLTFLHIEEGVTSALFGELSSTSEVEAGRHYLDGVIATVTSEGLEGRYEIRHSPEPGRAIINAVRDLKPDLLVMAAHGHKGLQDLALGATINAVRHEVPVPVLIVRAEA